MGPSYPLIEHTAHGHAGHLAAADEEVGDDLADSETVRMAGADAGHGLAAHAGDSLSHDRLGRADADVARGPVAAARGRDRCDLGAALEVHGDPAAIAERRERAQVVRAVADRRRRAEPRAHLRLGVAEPRAGDP